MEKEKTFIIRLNEKLHQRVKVSAAQRNISMSVLIRGAIVQHLELEEEKQNEVHNEV